MRIFADCTWFAGFFELVRKHRKEGDVINHGKQILLNIDYFKTNVKPQKEPSMKRDELLTQWVHDYADALCDWARYKTSDDEVARDLVQETFLAAVTGFDSFSGGSSPKTWLFQILNNKIVDFYRSRKRVGRSTEPMSEEQASQVTRSYFDDAENWAEATSTSNWSSEPKLMDNPEFIDVFDLCIDDLPENWKLAVAARYQQNKSSGIICKEMNITPTNYWQIIHRSKLLLKKCLEVNWK
jgi:RNA polymerase sigma-70 factor (TIGR02943 family)